MKSGIAAGLLGVALCAPLSSKGNMTGNELQKECSVVTELIAGRNIDDK
jgi:hypothetical protein